MNWSSTVRGRHSRIRRARRRRSTLYGIRVARVPSGCGGQAERLQKDLQHKAPGRRAVVMYRLPEEMSEEERKRRRGTGPEEAAIFFTHEYQGTLTVMPTLGDSHPNLILLDAGAQDIHTPEFITGHERADGGPAGA